jgi:hypothetical protein
MATTIKSTELDFNTIKNNLKLFLAQKPEFADYNFEASGLSNLLDVLAYNTHYNALLANFALNESFLSSAQLRSSIVSLAGSLGYTVGSRKASFAVVNLTVTNPSNPSSMTMPIGTRFTTTIDNKSYTFQTRDTLTAVSDNTGLYKFTLNGNRNIPIYEGVNRRKTFIVGPASEDDVLVIPVNNLDLDTVTVKVYDSVTSNNYTLYNNIINTTTINSDSKIYVIKESPNGYYELTFGNGARLGQTPQPGDKVEVDYTTVSGPEANGARSFAPVSSLNGRTISVTTVSVSSSGSYKEELESVRKNAPFQWAAQNRMVTAQDYAALILRNFSNVISDIKAWGGEDNIPVKYGTVFISIVFDTDDPVVIANTKSNIIALAKDLSVVSFNVEFVDPVETFLEVSTVFQFNPTLTSLSQTTVESDVKSVMQSYFNTNTGGFNQSFRRSNMLTLIDARDESILSSRSDIKMQSRFVPRNTTAVQTIYYSAPISAPLDDAYVIQSDTFLYNSKVCALRNLLESTVIQIIEVSTGLPVVDNIGSYSETNATISLSNFTGRVITGDYIRITALPANPAVINPARNNIIRYNAQSSRARAVLTDSL